MISVLVPSFELQVPNCHPRASDTFMKSIGYRPGEGRITICCPYSGRQIRKIDTQVSRNDQSLLYVLIAIRQRSIKTPKASYLFHGVIPLIPGMRFKAYQLLPPLVP